MGNDCCGARKDKPDHKIYVRLGKPEELTKIKKNIAFEFGAADKDNHGSLNFAELYTVTCMAFEEAGLAKPERDVVRRALYGNDKIMDKPLKRDEATDLIVKMLTAAGEIQKKTDEEAKQAEEAAAAQKKAEKEAKKKKPEEKKHEEDAKKK